MRLSRSLGVVALLSLCAGLFAGCSSDGDDPVAPGASGAGSGGKGGRGGSSGSSGSSSKATGGAAGSSSSSGGSGGSAGEQTAGAGGSSGASANAGSGGSQAGAAGASNTSGNGGQSSTAGNGGVTGNAGSAGQSQNAGNGGQTNNAGAAGQSQAGFGGGGGGASGSAGTSGAAGSAGAGGAPVQQAPACSYECAVDDDCKTEAGSFTCDPTRKRCVNTETRCETAQDCVAIASLWFLTCDEQDDCFGDVCVNVNGAGYCASAPAEQGCPSGTEPVTLKKIGSTDDVVVCASTAGRCNHHNECFIGCTRAEDCTGGKTCNVTTGACECTKDEQCPAGLGFGACVAGECGCSGTEVCKPRFKKTTPHCE